MYKLFKWIYRLGVLHERRRIKLLIAAHRQQKPELESYALFSGEKQNRKRFEGDLSVWYAVEHELGQLIDPSPLEMTMAKPSKAPIDQEG